MTPTDIKDWRTAQGLTQPSTAMLLGVHEITLSRWERGEREIPPYLHLALAELTRRRRKIIAARKAGREGFAAMS